MPSRFSARRKPANACPSSVRVVGTTPAKVTNPTFNGRFAVALPPVATRHAATSRAATARVGRFIYDATLTAVRMQSMRATIAAGHPATVEAGLEILGEGGSAADAAVAA